MTKFLLKTSFFILLLACGFTTVFAQTKVSGTITDGLTKEPLIGVSVQVKGKVTGSITDLKGNFSFTTASTPPFAIVVSSVGYQTQELQYDGKGDIKVALAEQAVLGQEVVVAASRVEESVLKSPVTVEKMDIRGIRETPSSNFYDGLANMKGIDMTTQSLLFKSINMRGFGGTGNPRIVQMIDGMDNSAPGLNFAVDNIVGMPELDVESVEILPGAASALYGPNAVNGLVLMNSKSPFLYQGVSANLKTGIMSASNRPTPNTGYVDGAFRFAKAINNKFAFKINLAYLKANDWQSTNYSNLNVGGNMDPLRGAGTKVDYDGVNSYGDEVQAGMRAVANSLISAKLVPAAALALVPDMPVSRTGYSEAGLVDNGINSFKFNGAAHYRVSDKVELVGQLNYGKGSTLYTGATKYGLTNFSMIQAKVELRGDNFNLRAYTTQERSGDSYAVGLMTVAMLNDIKPHATWFGEYVGTYIGARSAGQAEDAAHLTARAKADGGMPAPGSAAFNTLLEKYRAKNIVDGGGAFADKTNLYHAEGTYNLKNQIKFIDLLVGANFRQYQLRSAGTLFSDMKDGRSGEIPINEYGAFVQAGKSLFNDHVKLTASMRYDKSQNFDGQYSPRVSAVFSQGQHNIRVSYQTGFRIPTTQNQYIDLKTPSGILIGALPEFDSRYNLANGVTRETLVGFSTNPTPYITPDVIAKAQAYATAAVTAQLSVIQAAVIAAVQASVTAGVTASVNAAVAAGQLPAAAAAAAITAGVTAQMATPAIQQTIATSVQGEVVKQVTAVTTQVVPAFALATLPKYKSRALVPEKIKSIEFGYKGLIGNKVLVDASYYYNTYKDFIGSSAILVATAAGGPGLPIESGLGSATTRNAFSRAANSDQDIVVKGFSLGVNIPVGKQFAIGSNFSQNILKEKDYVRTAQLPYPAFNTPKNRLNLTFTKRMGSGQKYGFSIAYKRQWADGYMLTNPPVNAADGFVWQSSFVTPTTTGIPLFGTTLVPNINNIDAQVSFKLAAAKSIVKVGGTNLFGKPYVQAYGSPSVGSMYYVSLTFDELLNK